MPASKVCCWGPKNENTELIQCFSFMKPMGFCLFSNIIKSMSRIIKNKILISPSNVFIKDNESSPQ